MPDDRRVVVQQQSFSGPIPPPDALAHYERVVPGAARMIIEMADRQAKHRQNLEGRVIHSDVSNARLGLWFGLIIGLAGISAGTFLAYTGHTIVGTIFGGGTIVSLVGVFVYGSQGRKAEREQNKEEAVELTTKD